MVIDYIERRFGAGGSAQGSKPVHVDDVEPVQ
jgi:hypothetical protein